MFEHYGSNFQGMELPTVALGGECCFNSSREFFNQIGVNSTKEVLIGFNNSSTEIYLVVAGTVFSPDSSTDKVKIESLEERNLSLDRFIRLKEIDHLEIANFESFLVSLADMRIFSSIDAVIRILDMGLGIRVIGLTGEEISTYDFVEKILQNGFCYHSKRSVGMDLVNSKEGDLAELLARIRSFDHKISGHRRVNRILRKLPLAKFRDDTIFQ